MSQREAARTFGHGRDTIRKVLAHHSPPGYRRKKEPESPILDPVKPLIDAWLEEERAKGVSYRLGGRRSKKKGESETEEM